MLELSYHVDKLQNGCLSSRRTADELQSGHFVKFTQFVMQGLQSVCKKPCMKEYEVLNFKHKFAIKKILQARLSHFQNIHLYGSIISFTMARNLFKVLTGKSNLECNTFVSACFVQALIL